MSVALQAYRETWNWLESDRTAPEPKPPEGMHELSLVEWRDGYNRAIIAHAEEEAVLDKLTAKTMLIIKYLVLCVIVGVVYWWSNPYAMVATGVAGLTYLWRTRNE